MSRRDEEAAQLAAGLAVQSMRRITPTAETRAAFRARVAAAGKGAAGKDTIAPEEQSPDAPASEQAVVAVESQASTPPERQAVKPADQQVTTVVESQAAKPAKKPKPKASKRRETVISLPETKPGTKRNPRTLRGGTRQTRVTTIHFETGLLDWLDLAAALERVTLSHVVEKAVTEWLAKSGIPHPDQVKRIKEARS